FSVNYGAGATGSSEFTQGAATGVGNVSQGNGANQDILTGTSQFNLKYRHRADAWRLDAHVNWSLAESQWLDIERGHFNTAPSSISNLNLRGDDIPDSSGIIPTRYSAFSRTGEPVDIFDGGSYAITSGNSLQNDYNAEKMGGRVDFTREFNWKAPVTIKTGVF